MTKRPMRHSTLHGFAVAAALALVTGCAWIPRPERGPDGMSTVGWKVVVEKREPNLLLAMDDTECVVTRDRYEKVDVGDSVFCDWH